MYKIQVDGMAAMQQVVTSVIPKKSSLDNYRECKASLATILAAGDISVDVANQLIEKLNNEPFQCHKI